MLSFAAILFTLLSTSAHAETCPTFNDLNPAMVVDVSEYKFFYYPEASLSNEDQEGYVLIEKNSEIVGFDRVKGTSDWFSSIQLQGKHMSFSCDSQGMEFEGASFTGSDGKNTHYDSGQCREAGHKKFPLVCNQ